VRRGLARVNLAAFLVVLVAGLAVFNVWQRFEWGSLTVVVRNFTYESATVRLIDGTSGRMIGTYAVDGEVSAMLAQERLDIWYRDLSPHEEAAGKSEDFVVQLLGPEGCELVDQQRVDHRDPRIDIEPGGFVTFLEEPSPRSVVARTIADPCRGAPAIPRALIANDTTDTIIVARGVQLEACSSRTFHPGDLFGSAADAIVDGAIRVQVPSIEAQDERWPLEPRTVVISAEGVFDEAFGGPIFVEGDCRGHVPGSLVLPS
jgi:hypothetical protein